MNECVRILGTHFAAGTLLGDIVGVRRELDRAFESVSNSDVARRVLERGRSSISKFSTGAIRKAYVAALREASKLPGFDVNGVEHGEFDSLFESWLGNALLESVEAEERLLAGVRSREEAARLNEGASSDVREVPAELLPLVLNRAKELLEHNSSRDGLNAEQRELMKLYADPFSEVSFEHRAKNLVRESYRRLNEAVSQFDASAESTIKTELAKATTEKCESLLNEEQDWCKPDTLQSVLLVLESEAAILGESKS